MSAHLSKSQTGTTVRIFLAIDLPDSIRNELSALHNEFAGHAADLKWSASELLHITVRFLGGLLAERLTDVEEAARMGASGVQPFTLELSGLSAFPNERAPRVIWVGLGRDTGYKDLERLYRLTEDALTARGFPAEERAFSPHITLARTRDQISPSGRRSLGETVHRVRASADVSGSFPVDHFTVMRSDLSPRGPRYTPIVQLPLTGME